MSLRNVYVKYDKQGSNIIRVKKNVMKYGMKQVRKIRRLKMRMVKLVKIVKMIKIVRTMRKIAKVKNMMFGMIMKVKLKRKMFQTLKMLTNVRMMAQIVV